MTIESDLTTSDSPTTSGLMTKTGSPTTDLIALPAFQGGPKLRVRWLGRVAYDDALVLQRRLQNHSSENYLLLMQHPHIVTIGRRGSSDHILTDVEGLGARIIETDRGGEVTYHGPGQLVGYPILTLPGKRGGGMTDTAAYVASLEQLLVDVLSELGLIAGRFRCQTGVWIDPESANPRKIAAIGVRLARARSMHGFAFNVDCDLEWFNKIVPCGNADTANTSLAAEGVDVSIQEVVDLLVSHAGQLWGEGGIVDRTGVVYGTDRLDFTRLQTISDQPDSGGGVSPRLLGRLVQAGVDSVNAVPYQTRKPDWVKVKLNTGTDYRRLRSTMRDLRLTTVCEEAGCPNIYECWNDGTATFMILGERCTRSCGFCLVDTRRPELPDRNEPERVAEAAARMKLAYVVVTMVARDDLADGGAELVAETVAAVRRRLPTARVETLISDLGGDPDALQVVFDAKPDVLNHNIETVARLQRAIRPSAGYTRSLAVLCRAKSSGLTTKSSIIVGMGETHTEIVQTLADLNAVGTDIVTIGQYLRPSVRHVPVTQWWEPADFTYWKEIGESMGIGHVEASPLTRSSYHASQAAEAVKDVELKKI
ncbi:MAG: lipoyl synthase [Acidimicrobiaceae bacterium]|nr:lipoyl synthase [Acidimicrobiaceae bacterium]